MDLCMLEPHSFNGWIGYIEWPPSCQQFVGHTTQCILIALYAHLPLELLRGHVCRCSTPTDVPGSSSCEDHGNTKVGKERIALSVEEDVAGFEVTVYDILLVGIVECLSDLVDNCESLVYRH